MWMLSEVKSMWLGKTEDKYCLLSLFWCFVSSYRFSPRSVPPKAGNQILIVWMSVLRKNSEVHWISLQENWRCDSCFKLLSYSWNRKDGRGRGIVLQCCFAVGWKEKRKRGTRIDMDINRSRYLQKMFSWMCCALFIFTDTQKKASVRDISYHIKQVTI